MTPAQCRAARVLVDMTQADLSGAAIVPIVVLQDFEAGRSTPSEDNLYSLRFAITDNGIGFSLANETGPQRPASQRRAPHDIEGVIDQRLRRLGECDRGRQIGMDLERRLVGPMRVDEEQAFIVQRAIGRNRYATRLGARASDGVAQERGEAGLMALASMKVRDDEQVHGALR
jgi:hypothetical protein